MLISLIIISILTAGGVSITYLFADKETFLWRLAAGNIVGSAVFGLICFGIASFLGLTPVTVLVALVISLSPILLLWRKPAKSLLKDEWQRAKDKTQGVTSAKIWRLAYYIFFILLFIAFFDRAMIVAEDGIFTGASQNLGDLPFHLGAILSFAEGNNFPPQNPSFSGAKFTYPFIADFLTACLVKLGSGVKSAMFVQNVTWAFSLLIILERFVSKVTKSRFASKVAPFILFFSGGLGFLWFFKDYWYGAQSIWEIIWNLPRDYTISDDFRWGNSLIVLFITQRSLLLGMPLALIVLSYWTKIFDFKASARGQSWEKEDFLPFSIGPFVLGLITGMLPLIHAHSLAVLFFVSALWFFDSLKHWKEWIAFALGVSLIAVPALLWILSGSATNTSEFFAWHTGWDARDQDLLWFWIKNTGLFIPLWFAGYGYGTYLAGVDRNRVEEEEKKRHHTEKPELPVPSYWMYFLVFHSPFFFIAILGNIFKFAPWEWDNIKILIYAFVGSIPFVGFALAWIWSNKGFFRALAISLLVILTFSGALDVWRVASGQMRHEVFDKDAVAIAEKIKERTDPNSLFLNAPTYNSAVVLSGRPSLMRYLGHLSSHGIDYKERESDLKRIYSGAATAEIFLKKYNIEYVLISPKERGSLEVNEEYFKKYPVTAESGQYRVYKVK